MGSWAIGGEGTREAPGEEDKGPAERGGGKIKYGYSNLLEARGEERAGAEHGDETCSLRTFIIMYKAQPGERYCIGLRGGAGDQKTAGRRSKNRMDGAQGRKSKGILRRPWEEL